MTMTTTVGVADRKATDWSRLARRTLWNRTGFLAIVIGFLTIISLPIVLPYLWLLAISLTDKGGDGTAILWRLFAVAAAGYLALIAIALFAPEGQTARWLRWGVMLATVVVFAVGVGPYLTVDNFAFLWDPASVAAERGSQSRIGLMPSVWSAMGNSFAFAGAQTLIVTVVAAPAAYALSRFSFAGRESFLRGLLLLHAFPALALTVAIFIQMYWMGLLNSLSGVILVLCALELPFAIFVLKGFFDAVPWDIEMSAITDGASRFQAFRMVVLPQVVGGLIAVGTFTFLRGWEEYVFVQTLLIEKTSLTMSLYLFFVSEDSMGVDYSLVAAVGVVYVLPALVLYIFTQKYLTQMSFGGIKG